MVSNEKEIALYLHCGLCLEQKTKGKSMAEFKDLEVGWTEKGIQVWCRRHDCNVVHIDFEGQKHTANTTRASPSSKIKSRGKKDV